MRQQIISYFKRNPQILNIAWNSARVILNIYGRFKTQGNKVVFASFGGRKFDDSPKALYDEISQRHEFDKWDLVWAFVEPEKFTLPRGRKVKIDTLSFFKELLTAKIWISNSGIDRGIGIKKKGLIKVETWHGTPIKKIGGEENQNSMKVSKRAFPLDTDTIRCAQSDYDREIFARIFHASMDSFVMEDLPRNDPLLTYSKNKCNQIRATLKIPNGKKVILYVPTYREYLLNEKNEIFMKPPIDLAKWESKLSEQFVMLFRAHYAVNAALEICDSDFIRDVTDYQTLNDLYAIADLLISDYSSSFFDYSILNRPMLCFAYDLDEYEIKRGLYLKLEDTLPCSIDKNEDDLIEHIINLDYKAASEATKEFHEHFAPKAGNASRAVTGVIIGRISANG